MRSHFKFFRTFFLLFCFLSHISHAHLCDNTSSSLEFLNQFSRVQKGDNVKGVHELKNYLLYFGYLNYNRHPNNLHQGSENIFDDSLEIALRKYQQFYSLNVTGILDDNTITKMCQPRCGMPDFFNPNNNLPFHVISHYSFLRGKPKWHMMNLTYSFDWNVREEAKLALKLALNEWASATPFRFFHVRNFSRANIKVSFMSGDHGDGHPFGGSTGGLGHSFPPPDGRIHFDNHQNWSWTGKRNAYDIQSAGLHELGHVLGLGHSSVFKAIMYPILYPRERKGLHKDDIDGIKGLYKLRGKLY